MRGYFLFLGGPADGDWISADDNREHWRVTDVGDKPSMSYTTVIYTRTHLAEKKDDCFDPRFFTVYLTGYTEKPDPISRLLNGYQGVGRLHTIKGECLFIGGEHADEWISVDLDSPYIQINYLDSPLIRYGYVQFCTLPDTKPTRTVSVPNGDTVYAVPEPEFVFPSRVYKRLVMKENDKTFTVYVCVKEFPTTFVTDVLITGYRKVK